MTWHWRVVMGAAGVATAIGLWWGAVLVHGIRPFFLPAPPDVADALYGRWPYLLEQSAVTLGHTLAGFAIATAAGVAIATALAASRWLHAFSLPVLVSLKGVPGVVLAPLLIVWIGYGHESKIALVAFICFFPVLIATKDGLMSTPAELDELARSLTAGRWQKFIKIRFPWALPQIFVGLRLAIVLALIGAVVAQLHTPNSGLGAVVLRAMQQANTPLAFAAIMLLSAIGVGLFYTLVGVERLTLPWVRHTTAA